MPDLLAQRAGFIQGTGNSSFATARSSAGTATGGTSGGTAGIAFRYFFSSGRGGGTHSMYRTFLYFDTTGVAASAANIVITGISNNAGNFVLAKATAFGGDGGSALDTADFTEITTTAYTTQQSTFNIGTNTIALNSTAVTDITNNDAFIVAFMNNTNDFANTAATSNTTLNNGVNFGLVTGGGFSSIKLSYTAAATSDVTSINTIARASITSFNTIALANIDEINTIDN
jgi:hypothetical protein